MTFEGLKEAIQATGMATEGLSDEQIVKVGRALGLETPLTVEIVEYTPKGKNATPGNYVKTSNFPVTDSKGTKFDARGLFLRVEALDQAIEALQQAKALVDADDSED